ADLGGDCAQRSRTQSRFEATGGNLAREAAQWLFLVHADHRIVVAGHANVGDEAGSSGQDAVIGARRMGVSADHEARLAVDKMTEGPFLARRLGVEVDDRRVASL